jgi:hypothetical protein
MRVYHFINEEFGLKDIRERRLKISRIMELNDPFEFFGVELTDKEFRKAMRSAKESVAANTGIICFSGNWKNPVQWAHYADKHKGLCLGFDIDPIHLKKVEYSEDRIPHANSMTEELVFKLLRTKYAHWAYEEEYRVFVELKEDEGGIYYTDFEGNMELKQVIVGANSTVTRDQLASALGSLYSKVETFKVRPELQNFEMVKNQNGRMWV